ncbi:HD domain-containing protein [Pseudomonas sp. LTJR-52]|uniref:HD domain-containing protein n=1 Tax=Pseudomonas sp. LTJR-52 TaxID=2479392 RepID=UPI000EFAB3DA|nr:HD domain-containing protein [Pseudomonas sp. LTJR-52]AYN97041.1 HD domain-containing protein [Pseudomonas sp. LTJR-52]
MKQVNFVSMKEGTCAEYHFLEHLESEFNTALPERILSALAGLESTLSGYRVNRLEHSLQAATRAEVDGADEEMIVGALIHDLGDELAPYNHSQYAASIIRPYVRGEVTWVIHHHGLFQRFYYAHHFGGDPNERDRYKDHPCYELCVRFCERWDQASFDPNYPTSDLAHFAPMVRRIFSRKPFQPEILGNEYRLDPLTA